MPLVVAGQPHGVTPPRETGTCPGEPVWDTVEWPVRAVLAETPAALRVELDWPAGFALWLPKAQCSVTADRWVTIPGWLAQDRGLPATNTEYDP